MIADLILGASDGLRRSCSKGGAVLAILAGAGAFACENSVALREPDPDLNRMLEVPRGDPYEANSFFDDGMVMRTPPEGTVTYDQEAPSRGFGGSGPVAMPLELDEAALRRGREHFERTCGACHGALGDGKTVVAEKMKRLPPSLHESRLLTLSDRKMYAVIESGYGFMPSYASHLDPAARWEVVAYVRVLQLSRRARVSEMPAELAARAKEALR